MPHNYNAHVDPPASDPLEAGLAHHRSGRLSEAEAIYRELAAIEPANAHAIHYLGVIMLQRKHPSAAADLMDQAIRIAPGHAEFFGNRGLAAAVLGKHAEAVDFYRRALAINVDYADAHHNLANSLRNLQQVEDALAHYRHALALHPQFHAAACDMGSLLAELGRFDEAISSYQCALTLTPDDAGTLQRLGGVLKQTHRYADAVCYLERAVALAPSNVVARFNLAYVYDALHRFDDALLTCQSALALQPDSAGIRNNLGFALTRLARYEEAEAHYREAIRLQPGLSGPHYGLGMSLLRRGAFGEGWKHFEHRRTTESGMRNYAPLPFTEWQGESLQGKRLLLAREQGAGDQIQFIRYAAVLHQLGATVDAWVQDDLAAVFASTLGINRVCTQLPPSGYDYSCRMMSVPSVLPTDAPIPSAVPYLFADPVKSANWRARLQATANGKRKIGLVWAGNPAHLYDAFRSMPLDTLAPLAGLAGIAWYALQKGPAQSQIAGVASGWPLHALGDDLHDFSDTAALIDNLDLVITVDTSIAHLAGALGKPVWVLLATQPDWRWMLDRSESIWYPTAQLFRQSKLGEWTDVVDSIKAALHHGVIVRSVRNLSP